MEVERDEQIRKLAYRIWQEEGYPHGYEVQHWLKAEAMWMEEHRSQRPTHRVQEVSPKTNPRKPLKKTKSRKTADVQKGL